MKNSDEVSVRGDGIDATPRWTEAVPASHPRPSARIITRIIICEY